MDKYNDIQQQAIEERIDAFVRGAMTEAEEQAFKWLAVNPQYAKVEV